MLHLLSSRGPISRLTYAALAPALLLIPHAAVGLAYRNAGQVLEPDASFWLLPLRRLILLEGLTPTAAALVFASTLVATWALAIASLRRATRSGEAHPLVIFTVVPALQFAAVAILAVLPLRPAAEERGPPEEQPGANFAHVLQGLMAGMALIVGAVLVSAVTFGAYGWGLFVMTPFTVGITTAYVANRRALLGTSETMGLVLGALALGSAALVMLALEGVVCLIMAAPLGAAVALIGATIGQAMAKAIHGKGTPMMSVAVLPILFALEAAVPPAAPILVHQSIVIAAPRDKVWSALTSGEPIGSPPGLVGRAGLAYPTRSRLLGKGVDSARIGAFSTGIAHERVTIWEPGRRLAFAVLDQPPAMEEMSPYRRVHAPHVSGYFDTAWTSFELEELPGRKTRLVARAENILRIDPVPYWEPIARWAVRDNMSRVMRDIRDKAERDSAARP